MTDFLIFIAELLVISSYLFTNILILRILAALGMATYVAAGFSAGYDSEGMKAIIFFSSIAASINIIQIVIIIKENLNIFLPEEIRKIYMNNFRNMTISEFMKLYKISEKIKYKKSEIVIEENKYIQNLQLILSGEVEIKEQNNILAHISFGNFLGEMSYITGERTSASAFTSSDELECLRWDHSALENFKSKKPELYSKFFESLAINLTKKLLAKNKNTQHKDHSHGTNCS